MARGTGEDAEVTGIELSRPGIPKPRRGRQIAGNNSNKSRRRTKKKTGTRSSEKERTGLGLIWRTRSAKSRRANWKLCDRAGNFGGRVRGERKRPL